MNLVRTNRLIAFVTTSLFSALLPETLRAEVSLTAVAAQQANQVYVATKDQPESFKLRSGLVRLDTTRFKVRPTPRAVPLPKELLTRELIAVIPSKKQLYVVSQWTIEQGDEPWIHALNLRSRQWHKVGQIPCIYPNSIEVTSKGLEFECEFEGPDGNLLRKKEQVALKKHVLPKPQTVKIPQTQATANSSSFTLEGRPHHWDQLKIRTKNQKEYLIWATRLKIASTSLSKTN